LRSSAFDQLVRESQISLALVYATHETRRVWPRRCMPCGLDL